MCAKYALKPVIYKVLAAAFENWSVLLLIEPHGIQQIRFKRSLKMDLDTIALLSLHQIHPHLNCMQQLRISFPKLWSHLWNLVKFAPRKITHYTVLIW